MTRTNIDRDWRFHAEKKATEYQVHWTRKERALFGDIEETGGIDGIMWSKAGRSLGPANPDFDDTAWERIDLPHDWSIAQAPTPSAPERNGFSPLKVLWYRKRLALPAHDEAGRAVLCFDGAYRQATVFINGHLVHSHESGYIGFRVDFSDVAEWGGENTVAVRLDARRKEGWFYEGAGIYRHVWLELSQPVYLRPDGFFVQTDVDADGAQARVRVEAEVVNDGTEATDATLVLGLDAPDGDRIRQTRLSLSTALVAGDRRRIEGEMLVEAPRRWDIDNPVLYRLTATLQAPDGAEEDRLDVPFGIRSFRFDPDQGFFLNGRRLKLKGVGNHMDHTGVGMAVPDRLQEYRITLLKEMGVNAYRCGHNPPAPEFLDACDRLGMLVMDENRIFGSSPEVLGQVEALVRRDRNHPCVVMWSLGNEEMAVQFSDAGERILRRMKRVVRRLDTTRPVIMSINGGWGRPTGIIRELDLLGANYLNLGDVDECHRQHARLPFILAEACSHVCTRGEYEDSAERNVVQAYDRHVPVEGLTEECIWPRWGRSAEDMWKVVAERDFIAGVFTWVGIDHRGESTPFNRWPCTGCNFGAMDACGFPKDVYYYYRAWWRDEPLVHIFPHWTWPGREGDPVEIWCYSNGDEAELFLNDRSLGTQAVPRYGHVEWAVPYEPGCLRAETRRAGQVVATCERRTAGPPAALHLASAYPSLRPDGSDIAIINAEMRDAAGVPVPDADHRIRFSVEGPARVIGVGNGDPRNAEALCGPDVALFHGLAQVILRSTGAPGRLVVHALIDGMPDAKVCVDTIAER